MKKLKNLRFVFIIIIVVISIVLVRLLKQNYFKQSVQESYEQSLSTDENITYKAFIDNKDDYHLIDLRSNEEYKAMHLEGAENVPFNELLKNLKFKNKRDTWVLYSRDVSTTVKAKLLLNQMGFVNVYYLDLSEEVENQEFNAIIGDIDSNEEFKYEFRPDTTIRPE